MQFAAYLVIAVGSARLEPLDMGLLLLRYTIGLLKRLTQKTQILFQLQTCPVNGFRPPDFIVQAGFGRRDLILKDVVDTFAFQCVVPVDQRVAWCCRDPFLER